VADVIRLAGEARERKKERRTRTRLARHTRPLRKRKGLTESQNSGHDQSIFDHKVIDGPESEIFLSSLSIFVLYGQSNRTAVPVRNGHSCVHDWP
jgi:hypothetical protein